MNYVFPNELHVTWTVMIVLYPYITGLVAGAFIVSSLYHVFGRDELKPIARYSLAAAFIFLLFATLPLLMHLGRPERAFNIMLTPHFTSAMAGFGYIYSSYLVVVALEIWFVMRGAFLVRAREKGPVALLCRAIMLFNTHESAATREADHRVARFLAGLGIPMACILHGYVGFLFGSIKANPWWATPLMFVIFIFSAIVSGISVLIFHYFTVSRIKGWRVDSACVKSLARYLWGFMMIAVALEVMEVVSLAYEQTEATDVLGNLIRTKLFVSYVLLQFLLCSLVPFLLLGITALFKLRERTEHLLIWVSSGLLLLQVLLMRWNVVVGGQLVSKSMRGFTSYLPGIWEKEGLITAAVIITMPIVLLVVFNWLIPLFPDAQKKDA